MSENDLPDPFQSAKRVPGIHVHLRPEDLLRSDSTFDRTVVAQLMERHGGTLAAAMLSAGIEAAIDIREREGGKS
jgi:hypothetical protein